MPKTKDKKKPHRFEMIGQIYTADMSMLNGVAIRDVENNTEIRATVLEAQSLYESGRLDMPPY